MGLPYQIKNKSDVPNKTKIELKRMNDKILELKKELNNNVAMAGKTAIEALEQNRDTRIAIEIKSRRKIIS